MCPDKPFAIASTPGITNMPRNINIIACTRRLSGVAERSLTGRPYTTGRVRRQGIRTHSSIYGAAFRSQLVEAEG